MRVEPIQQITNCSDRVYFSTHFPSFLSMVRQLLFFKSKFFKTIKQTHLVMPYIALTALTDFYDHHL
jgi:hypothetical protein